MSNTPAHFTLFVLSDWQGHCQGRLLQSRNELQKSPIPGCSFHHHWNRDVCGGSCGPHRLLVQAWTCIAVGPVSLVGGDRDKEETRWGEGKRQGWRRFLHLSWRRVPVLLPDCLREEEAKWREKTESETERKQAKTRCVAEYYLDCILIRTESLFVGCNTPTDKVFRHHHKKKRQRWKDDYSST